MPEFDPADFSGWDSLTPETQRDIRAAHQRAEEAVATAQRAVGQHPQQEPHQHDISGNEGDHGDSMHSSSSVHDREGRRQTTGDDLAHLLARVITLGGQSGTLKFGAIEKWTGSIKSGEDQNTKVVAFTTQFISFCQQENLLEVLEGVPIRVLTGDKQELVRLHGEEAVAKSFTLMSMLVEKIQFGPVNSMILTSGSPQEGWSAYVKFYEKRAGSERARLSKDWAGLKQGVKESSRDFLARGIVIATSLSGLQRPMEDSEVNHHLATALAPRFETQRSILLAEESLSFETLQRVVQDYEDHLDARGKEEESDADMRYALVVQDRGRGQGGGDVGGRTSGGRGHGLHPPDTGWPPERPKWCTHHQTNTHDDFECKAQQSQYREFILRRRDEQHHRAHKEHLERLYPRPDRGRGNRHPPPSDHGQGHAPDTRQTWSGGEHQQGRGRGQSGRGRGDAGPGGRGGPGGRMHRGGRGGGRGGGGGRWQAHAGHPTQQNHYRPQDARANVAQAASSSLVTYSNGTFSYSDPERSYVNPYGRYVNPHTTSGDPYELSEYAAYAESAAAPAPAPAPAERDAADQGYYAEPQPTQQQPEQQQQLVRYSPQAPLSSASPSPGSRPGGSSLHLLVARLVPRGESDFSPPGVPDLSDGGVGSAFSVFPVGTADLCQPEGSEIVHSDSGATGHYFGSGRLMFDVTLGANIPLSQRYVQIGNGELLTVTARGSLMVDFHQWDSEGQREDIRVLMRDVSVVEGLGPNLFSLHAVSVTHEITLDENGTHVHGCITFPRNAAGASLYFTRVPQHAVSATLTAHSGFPPDFPPPQSPPRWRSLRPTAAALRG